MCTKIYIEIAEDSGNKRYTCFRICDECFAPFERIFNPRVCASEFVPTYIVDIGSGHFSLASSLYLSQWRKSNKYSSTIFKSFRIKVNKASADSTCKMLH